MFSQVLATPPAGLIQQAIHQTIVANPDRLAALPTLRLVATGDGCYWVEGPDVMTTQGGPDLGLEDGCFGLRGYVRGCAWDSCPLVLDEVTDN